MDLKQLVEARRQKKFIKINSFSLELLDAMRDNGGFPIVDYNGKQYDNYQTMVDFVNKDDDLTDGQQRVYNTMLMKTIFPFLDEVIAGKIDIIESPAAIDKPHCETCNCYEDKPTVNELSEQAKLLMQSNERNPIDIDESDLPF